MAMKRKKLSMKKSKRIFKKGAKKVHKKNRIVGPMRGGIRL